MSKLPKIAKPRPVKWGPNDGNSGAVVRWGERLDNGIWLTANWRRFRARPGYIALPFVTVMWGNDL